MGVYKNLKRKTKFINFPSPPLKTHAHFNFSSCVLKNSTKTIFRPRHRSTPKDFNQIGKKNCWKIWSEFWFWFRF